MSFRLVYLPKPITLIIRNGSSNCFALSARRVSLFRRSTQRRAADDVISVSLPRRLHRLPSPSARLRRYTILRAARRPVLSSSPAAVVGPTAARTTVTMVTEPSPRRATPFFLFPFPEPNTHTLVFSFPLSSPTTTSPSPIDGTCTRTHNFFSSIRTRARCLFFFNYTCP